MPFVSVLTPTWNRASYLSRVWTALSAQTSKNFEWIVANDGSSDETVTVVRELGARSDFAVTLIDASCRIGKSRMDNEAVRAARGQFVLWCDSDDTLEPNAIEILERSWSSVPEEERGGFLGVAALCRTAEGTLGRSYPKEESVLTLNELLWGVKSDLVILARSDLMKATPFPEVDFLAPETSVWNVVGLHKVRFVPLTLKQANYGEANCVSFSGLMEYNRGRAYAMAISNPHVEPFLSPRSRMVRALNFLRYSIHGEIRFPEALRLWNGGPAGKLGLYAAYPLAMLLAARDKAQKKVRRTHREFLRAAEAVQVHHEVLSGD